MLQFEVQNAVALLRLEHGKANTIDIELFTELERKLSELERSPIKAIVLTGSGNTFSAGVDLFRVVEEGAEYIQRFLPLLSSGLQKLFLFPKPVIAAVNGHAIAGGCLLVSCGDYRIMSEGTIGMPELVVGVPFPSFILEIVRFIAPPQFLQEIVYTGRTYTPEDARVRGLVDETTSQESLLSRAFEMANVLASAPSEAFRLTKTQLRSLVVERARSFQVDEDLMRLWCAPETHAVIKAYLQKTIGKSKRG
ncbi:MAG: enoyl-CoA hydratase/isomerase family protein [Acidobacteria bacterium]|nr:MAG: enoyl-CoA hydratase/isomerase family protein [Acidobacteriota bacterium]